MVQRLRGLWRGGQGAPTAAARAATAAGREHIDASAGRLTAGGRPPARGVRNFFEARMGRDLSQVRVHEGQEAQGLNGSIAARAFTYSNHVWLGSGERADTSFTMAHELAHVLQQIQPGPVGARPTAPPSLTGAQVRRVPCNGQERNLFFAPRTKDGIAKGEHDFVGSLAKGGILGEAPILNAVKSVGGCDAAGRTGYADLFWSNTGKFVGFGVESEAGPTNPGPGTPWIRRLWDAPRRRAG